MASAQRVYDRNCATCHGYDARARADLFPDLRDAVWQWGGDPAQIEASIPAWAPGCDGRVVARRGEEETVGHLDATTCWRWAMARSAEHPGAQPYTLYCSACHGPDGAGNAVLGASNLLDDVSLYGNSAQAVRHSIAVGRDGEMPHRSATGSTIPRSGLLVAWLTGPAR